MKLKNPQLSKSDRVTDAPYKRKKSTIIREGQDKPRANKDAYYVDNVRFYNELIEWQDGCIAASLTGNKPPKIPDYVGFAILNICKRLGMLRSFFSYTYVDEMSLAATEACIKKLRNFDRNRTHNPFAYFTQIAYYSFIGTIAHEEKIAVAKYKMTLERMTSGDSVEQGEHTDELSEHIMDNVELQVNYLEEVIGRFEKKREKQSKKAKVNLNKDLME